MNESGGAATVDREGSLKVLLCPVGSSGDVHPLVGVGRALKARGHEIVVIGNSYFEDLHRLHGFEFHSVGDMEEYKDVLADPDLWHPRRGFPLLARRMMIPQTKKIYDEVMRLNEPGRTVVVAPAIAFGARLARERHDVPLVTALLQPSMLRSDHDPPMLPGMPSLTKYPWWAKRFLYWLADTLVVDRVLGPPLNQMRRELGLRPIKRILGPWCFSPDSVLALYPEWFYPRQPDWPAQYRTSDFPRYDESNAVEIPPEAEAFLAAGEAPVVFTFGSANQQAEAPFGAALDAVKKMNRRAVFIARAAENLPTPLPASVLHAKYLPFSWIFPRAAAVVHHGGIGTTAQAFAAGTPQLIMPMGYDQFDNAERVRRLGVGEELRPKNFLGPAVAAALTRLLVSPAVASACRAVRDRLAGPVDFGPIVETIERVARRRVASESTASVKV